MLEKNLRKVTVRRTHNIKWARALLSDISSSSGALRQMLIWHHPPLKSTVMGVGETLTRLCHQKAISNVPLERELPLPSLNKAMATTNRLIGHEMN